MPAIWLIDAYRAGERGQVRALADALAESLGWPCRRIELQYRAPVILPHVLGGSSIRGITAESAAQLAPPWPDLVITCGVRNEPVCRWIRARSSGRTRYLHLGRPWGPLDSFDLVVTTPQYRVPERPNVVNNELTLHGLNRDRLDAAARRWAPELESLPKPYVAVSIGGDSGPYTFGPRAARRLAREASALARESGGSLLVSTSSRTSKAAADAFEENVEVPCRVYRWQPDDVGNPYLGMLALAQQLVVTGDSIAMLSEACATGKPVYIFDLGGMREERSKSRDFRWGGFFYALLMRWGWQRLSRDIRLVHGRLLASGRATWLGEGPQSGRATPVSDMTRAVKAARSLLGQAEPAVDIQQPGAAVD